MRFFTSGDRESFRHIGEKIMGESLNNMAEALDTSFKSLADKEWLQAGVAELSKVKRVLSKLDPGAPHEVLLIIDGSTGQNAINQCRAFNEAVGVTGLVVTKLDGSAKGGVLFALASEFGIPIRFIGLGEKPEDLRAFEPESYVNALLPHYS